MAAYSRCDYLRVMKCQSLAEHVWNARYRYCPASGVPEKNIGETWTRVAAAVADGDRQSAQRQHAFHELMSDYRFLPGGRILASAGTTEQQTLFNCFVMGPIPDSIAGILNSLGEAAATLQYGGGILDRCTIRPAGTRAVRSGSVASGPVSFMHLWDTLSETLTGTSVRPGAMMATLRCDHPDIEAFVDAKAPSHALRHFNLSVLVCDEFLKAVSADVPWDLCFPAKTSAAAGKPGTRIRRTVPARSLWQRIVRAARETAEPGVLFVDTINRENNLYYCEDISATNPCGEIPLPHYGACNLGSLNLAGFVRRSFSDAASLDDNALQHAARIAVRFLDNVIDISCFPLPAQAEQAHATRRIGLGVTGLADALVMLNLHYDSDAGRSASANAMALIRNAAYAASIELAAEKGAFPLLDLDRYLKAPFVRRLPKDLQAGISEHGIRNSHLLAIAPAGSISLLAGNVSSGIEPIYAYEGERDVRGRDLQTQRFFARDYAYDLWLKGRRSNSRLPDSFVSADELSTQAHLAMQSTMQKYVDSAVSKTVNLPKNATADDVALAYRDAHRLGIKGCTVFRSGLERGQVLRSRAELPCCDVVKEANQAQRSET